jgi:hypothetical protein
MAPIQDLDGSAANDPEVVNRPVFGEHDGAAGERLDLGPGGEALQIVGIQQVEGGLGGRGSRQAPCPSSHPSARI